MDMLSRSLAVRLNIDHTALVESMQVLTASMPEKLSFHVVTPVVVDGCASAGSIAYEIGLGIRKHELKVLTQDGPTAETLLMLLIFDLVPYGERQLLRLAGI
ncbi:hypothetical protein L202_03157 [Cryptococcus amylolentus CBS 6039]|uniref:Uncharacterized protein n=1 Tax=Cryptococcus amylolentus CBS 6039 TaxID=1295533 RepID=A0A1E3HZT1_9TREE|nr:hypothetical protein L202_03157 [Cryptococcus amylolentus CBS 6039]ODN81061.1 hypothetical protein L202_03157 [Cryptococcus amylolentus CBS 6039]